MSEQYPRTDPKSIIIERETRQRQENIDDVMDLMQSISQLRKKSPTTGGLIQPIVVRAKDNQMLLVAGERRLKAVLALDLPDIPYRMFEDLSTEEAEVIELEENVKRRELSWRDQVRAVTRIHALYKSRSPGWKVEQTAEAISLHHSQVRKILHVNEGLISGRITRADGVEQAYNTLHKIAERKAESIVSDLIVKGTAAFNAPVSAVEETQTKPSVFFDEGEKKPEKEETQPIEIGDEDEDEATNLSSLIEENNEAPIPSPPPVNSNIAPRPQPLPEPILCANFSEWIKTYSGPKFSLIHCDFPYGNYKGNDSRGAQNALDTEDFYDNTESVYWNLLDTLTKNLDKIMSYSAHLVFWFNMNFYTETVNRLRKTGLTVHDHPLIWHKTGGPGGLGVAPGTDATHPRRTYDTALIGVRGGRPLVRSMCNSYAAPTAGNKIHPSQKPEPMLRYFLQMFVDEATSVFDPTCGSAAALRAAEDLGAKSVFGLELDENYARDANTKTLQARLMRQAGTMRRSEAV